LLILALIFATAGVTYRLLNARMKERISLMTVSPVFKLALHNLRKQVFAVIALALLFFAQLAAAAELLQTDMGLAGAISGLLLAWIVIRMALQFMPNPFMRNIFTLTIWSLVALSLLGILDNTAEALDALALTVGTFRLSALTVAKGSLAVFFLLYLATIAATLLEKRIHTVAGLSISSRVLLGKIIRVTLIVFALLIAITAAGIDLSLLAVFSGAVGLGVGFGLQKVASNLFSGMMLLMDRSITPGDVIELPNGAFGWVNHMGARYTEIVTRDNKAYLVPNEDFVTQQVINWSHGDRLIRIEVQFGVHYDSDPHLVKKLAEEVAQKPERVVGDPSPVCHLVEFGDSSLNFVLRFWIEDAEKGVTNMRGAVMLALWDAFKENDISIPYPHREVFMHNPPEKNRA
jgi:small-conductance mechanosensitive channel